MARLKSGEQRKCLEIRVDDEEENEEYVEMDEQSA